MARGRKRKTGTRYPCGKLERAETEREAMAVALDARRRHYGVSIKRARDQRLGSTLGRLAFTKLISNDQHEAGRVFGELYQRHHAVMGLPAPTPRSIAGRLIEEGIMGLSPSEPTLDQIERLRRRFREAATALTECDRTNRFDPGRGPSHLVHRVVCTDEDTLSWSNDDIANLRVGLNALVRVFRI
ncbi:hypothetical protein [Aquibium sp. ELW1220]|uniref:hypothetical protein n=1 Tax=Aquibium sp. ELW1220 TaxID=2976766 RepID=UPI0025AFA400|nr:hypothetical protein [Aquibium sp. ELW1220]MDN2579010.1 hypothetical protein [Aquibium sp. ELW1220]